MTDAVVGAPGGELLRLVHHHPGRLRVRADALRDEAVRAAAMRALESVPGVQRASGNAQTGSVLIEYEPGLGDPDRIAETIARAAGLAGVIDHATDPSRQVKPSNLAIDVVRTLNEVTREVTGGRAGLGDLVPAALMAVAAYSFAKADHERVPRWDNALMWSYGIFMDWHRREIDRRGRRADPATET